MRFAGNRRGNPTLRFMIDQSARRRMSWIHVDGDGGSHLGDPLFFARLRDDLLPRMAHVADTPEGHLHYFGSRALSVWAFVSGHALALAYEHFESPAQIRERAGRWLRCLASRTAPGLASPHWGHPVYGAKRDPHSGEVDVVWAFPGEWVDAVLADALPSREWDAPPHWRTETQAATM